MSDWQRSVFSIPMNPALEKTLTILLLLGIGLLLKRKVPQADQLLGIKVLVLSVALPATIFVALLKVQLSPELIWLPLLALAVNVGLLGACYAAMPLLGFPRDSPAFRTLLLLIPSLAPGLSCFPFLMEYLGEEMLAQAALADVGNKVFVLLFLYGVAMHFYYQALGHQTVGGQTTNPGARWRGLLRSLVSEPVNLVLVVALGMLACGKTLETLPFFLQDGVQRASAMMTPLVLLFIGLAVKFRRREFQRIAQVLALRAGITLLASSLLLALQVVSSPQQALLVLIFPLSSVSFWPFAHMSAVATLENKQAMVGPSRFDLDLAVNTLALSLPFSTLLILLICAVGAPVAQPIPAALAGFGLLLLGLLPTLLVIKNTIAVRLRKGRYSLPPVNNQGEPAAHRIYRDAEVV